MRGNDAFYTPDWLSDVLVDSLPASFTGTVVDPCVGDGSLLKGVVRRHGSRATVLGIDIDGGAVRRLRKSSPEWTVSIGDFTKSASLAATSVMGVIRRTGVDWIVLNPPFSYRGNTGASEIVFDNPTKLVRPLQFVWLSLARLNPRLGLSAILPTGVIDGERHGAFWKLLAVEYDISVTKRLDHRVFSGAVVHTALVIIRPKSAQQREASAELGQSSRLLPRFAQCRCVRVIRGRVPNHSVLGSATEGQDFMHTSDLRAAAQGKSPRRLAPARLATMGHLLIFPRIGNPHSFTPVAWSTPIVLSDCLFALRVESQELLDSLSRDFILIWSHLKLEFKGSGAQYLTVSSIIEVLEHYGYMPSFVPASSPPDVCQCEANGASASAISHSDELLAV